MARAITSMRHEFNLAVAAQRVENAEQRAFLEASGCDLLQGYWLRHPLPAGAIDALLDAAP